MPSRRSMLNKIVVIAAAVLCVSCTDSGQDDGAPDTTIGAGVVVPSSTGVAAPAGRAAASGASNDDASTVTPTVAPGGFIEMFTGTPGTPTSWTPANWDVVVHSRDEVARYELESMAAMHGEDCAGPPATHEITAYDDAVFQCRDHLMTAIKASGYGLIYLTPNQLVDMSSGEAVISWDMSTARSTLRDWVDLWITPFGENMILPFESSDPDLQGPPRDAVHIRMDQFDGKAIFKATIYKDFQAIEVPDQQWWKSYEDVLEPDAARRDKFELTISPTHMKFGMPDYDLWWADTAIDDLGFTAGVVQFGHHSYNPMKDCSSCIPNTWHWDNVAIAPAKGFTIIDADRRLIDASSDSKSVSFSTASPSGSFLRFSGQGSEIELSVDGGSTWAPAVRQRHGAEIRVDHASSYWTPIPAGVSTVAFRGSADFVVRDVSVFSLAMA